MSRRLLFAVLLYLTLDFCLPSMPGAFQFDPLKSVESVGASRVAPVATAITQRPGPPDPVVAIAPSIAVRRRPLRVAPTVPVRLAGASGPRAAAPESPPPSEDAG